MLSTTVCFSNGQKLLRVKMKLEMDLWGLVSDEQVEFEGMFPLMSNSEKEIGDLTFSPAQVHHNIPQTCLLQMHASHKVKYN